MNAVPNSELHVNNLTAVSVQEEQHINVTSRQPTGYLKSAL